MEADEEFEAAHQRLLSAEGFQFDLPVAETPKLPDWLRPLLEFLASLAPYFKYVLWGCAALGLAIILLLILRELLGVRWRWPWARAAMDAAPEADLRPEAAAARALLAEADALAARGAFAEAVHLLLGRSIEHLADRRPDLLRPSSTARELVGADLPDPVRTPLARIVRAVELSLFGGTPLGEGDWGDCRRAYEAFAFPGNWR